MKPGSLRRLCGRDIPPHVTLLLAHLIPFSEFYFFAWSGCSADDRPRARPAVN
jgi:hypothetical protein